MSRWPDIVDMLDGVTRQRVAWPTFSGTWAAPGTGYPSWILQNCDDGLVFEVPVQAPWSFGPVGSPDLMAPSYAASVDIAVDWAVRWLLSWPGLFGLCGYSQGGEAASRVYEETYPGGRLAGMADRLVGGVSLGDPMRPAGVTGGGMPDPGGSGIAPKRVRRTHPNWHYHANGRANGAPGPDMYTATPNNNAGAIIRTFYSMLTQMGLADFGATVAAMVKGVVELLSELLAASPATPDDATGGGIIGSLVDGLGGPLVGVLGPLAAIAAPLLANVAIPSLMGGLGGLGGLTSLLGGIHIVDAIEAAIFALQFLFEGTGPHITYDTTDAIPGSGINHIGHAVGHVNTISAAALRNLAA